jgi:hypothetical protein
MKSFESYVCLPSVSLRLRLSVWSFLMSHSFAFFFLVACFPSCLHSSLTPVCNSAVDWNWFFAVSLDDLPVLLTSLCLPSLAWCSSCYRCSSFFLPGWTCILWWLWCLPNYSCLIIISDSTCYYFIVVWLAPSLLLLCPINELSKRMPNFQVRFLLVFRRCCRLLCVFIA